MLPFPARTDSPVFLLMMLFMRFFRSCSSVYYRTIPVVIPRKPRTGQIPELRGCRPGFLFFPLLCFKDGIIPLVSSAYSHYSVLNTQNLSSIPHFCAFAAEQAPKIRSAVP
jgi:hypothetical protein